MKGGRLDTLGRWIWAAVCLALAVIAVFKGGFRMLFVLIAVILVYAVVFATIATIVSKISRLLRRIPPAQQSGTTFGRYFRQALVDGPVFLLSA